MFEWLFIETAWAQGAGAPAAPSLMESLAIPALMMVALYFLMIRPQQKKTKEHQKLLSELKNGDEIVTTGGIIGRIRSVSDIFVTIDAGSNTTLKVQKNHVTGLMTKPTQK